MTAKSKRPKVLDLGSLMVKPAPAPSIEPQAPVAAKKAAPKDAFRTSVYFHRAVHDKLRDIAHEERKTVMDLINEGLDVVLTRRNYPTTGELRGKA